MYPPLGESNVYFRVRAFIRRALSRAVKKVTSFRPRRPNLGSVWLRLSFFEERLIRLNEDNREVFIENFYHSARQVNYMTLLTVFVIILTFLTSFQFRMIELWQGIAVEGLLVLSLFYVVWYYRMGMEDLLDFLQRTETIPDYAFRPRLSPGPAKKVRKR